jgi:tetratricopeptide (TPR) repeat protein
MLPIVVLAFLLAAPDEGPATLIPRLEHAVALASVEQLEQCRQALLAEAGRSAGRDGGMARYNLAYVEWRLYDLSLANRVSSQRGQTYLQDAGKLLQKVVADDPGNAEAHALLSTVYGQEIGTSMWKGMTLGPKASWSIDTAMKLARDNPRVALQAGVGAWYTPKMFGGGMDKAEKELRRAEALFARQPADAPWPNWGRLDILAWMGQLLAAKGDRPGARAYYHRALESEPDYVWVRDVLLPALDKPARKK